MFYIYILKSVPTGKYYIGPTNNLEKRLLQHNSGYSLSTKRGIPWELVYIEKFEQRSEAMRREYDIKSKKSKIYIEHLLEINRASR